jgi:hypothetical protein
MIDQQQSLHTAKGKEKVRSTAKATMAGSEVPALMQLHEIQSKYLADLVFLHAEFTKVKNHLPAHQTLAGASENAYLCCISHCYVLLQAMTIRRDV